MRTWTVLAIAALSGCATVSSSQAVEPVAFQSVPAIAQSGWPDPLVPVTEVDGSVATEKASRNAAFAAVPPER